jgi:hypothetical protein
MFEKAFSMFAPFGRKEGGGGPSAPDKPAQSGGDIDAMKRELEEMRRRLDQMTKDKS